jgi:hypothetical protein
MQAKRQQWPIQQVEMALDAVSQAFAQVKAEPTPAEASLWAEEIDRLGPQPVLAFVRFWMSGGGQGGFLRAPRVDDARRFVDPEWMDAGTAMQKLVEMVSRVGPYRVPSASEGMTTRLADAVMVLGGWPHVCETLPAQNQEFAYRDFLKRFEDAWGRSQARALMGLVSSSPLAAIGQSSGAQAFELQGNAVDRVLELQDSATNRMM